MNPSQPYGASNTQIDQGAQPVASVPLSGQSVPSAIPQPQQPQDHANWIEKLLPTIGGIGGGLLGSLTDAFTGPLGTIGGSAAGGAAGQALEDALTGDKGNIGAAAAENAVGAGVGGGLAKVGSLLAGKLVAPLAEKGATSLFAGQAPGITKDLANYMVKDNGITDTATAGKMADVLTGSAGGANEDVDGKAVLNKFVENTLQNQGPQAVKINDLAMSPATPSNVAKAESVGNESNTLQGFITNNSLSSTPQANAIRSQVSAIIKSLPVQDAAGSTDPLSALGAQRQVASLANNAYDNYIASGRDATMKNVADTYNDVSNELKSRLNLHGIPVSDEDKEALASDVEKFGSPVSKQAATNVANQIRNTDGLTLGGVRNLESNWVQVKGALQQAADQANKNFGTSTGQMARGTLPLAGSVVGIGGPKSLLGTVGGLATSSPVADKAGAAALAGVAKGAKGVVGQKIMPLLTRIGAIGASNLPNIADSSAAPQNNVLSQTGDQMQQGNNALSQLYGNLLAQEQASPANFAGSLGPVLAQLAPLIQKQQIAGGVVGNLGNAYSNAGGAQGLGGGILSQLTGLVPGTAANTYGNQQQATASTLAQLLGISPQAAMQMIPQLTQSPTSAGITGNNLNSVLGSIGG